MTIAVDFDGTIVEHRYPAIGKEIPYAIETLKRLQQDRHQLILWTAREGQLLVDAVEFCRTRGLVFYAINSDVPNDGWKDTSPTRKLKADMFIDDRNVGGLPDWSVIYEMISKNLTYGDILRRNRSFDSDEEDEDEELGFFARIKERCSSSRSKYNRKSSSSSHYHHKSRHHW